MQMEALGAGNTTPVRNHHHESMFPVLQGRTGISDNEGKVHGSAEKTAVWWQLQTDNIIDPLETLSKSVVNKDVMLPVGLSSSWKGHYPVDT